MPGPRKPSAPPAPRRPAAAARGRSGEGSGKTRGRRGAASNHPIAGDRRFRSLVENGYDAIILISREAVALYASPALPRVIGYTVEEFVGQDVFGYMHPEDLALTRGRFADCLRSPDTPIQCEFRYRHKDGSWRLIEAVGINRLADRDIGAIIANFRDVTDRRRTEEALREGEARFRSFVESSADWVWACDVAGRVTYSNDATIGILGYRPEELEGVDSFDLLHPADREPSRVMMDECVARKRGWRNFTCRWRHKDGTYRDVESTGVPILDATGSVVGFRGLDRDVTERRRLEDQLRQSQKMEAVGRLAGGVAHDFNNLLTAILGYARLLLGRDEPGPEWRQEIQEIQTAARRAADLTQQLLAFGRRQVLVLEVFDLGDLVRGMERTLRGMIGDTVALRVTVGSEPCHIRAGRSQIEQVLMNLAVNARDAMPEGGSLTITVGERLIGADYEREHPGARAGRYAMLSVRDTGVGIDAATRSHLFEPFFTTKPVGQGSGLGLATVYGIVKQGGGYIGVESRPGEGTEFQVLMPRAAAPATRIDGATGRAGKGGATRTADMAAATRTADLIEEAAGATAATAGREPETILVVEDDRAVRLLVREILEGAGHHVLEAGGGDEALRLAADHQGPIDLLLADVIMPGMSGREVSDRLAAIRPGIPTLYMSGYTDDAVVRHGVAVHEVDFLEKPFTPEVLVQRVRAALDRAAARSAA